MQKRAFLNFQGEEFLLQIARMTGFAVEN